MAKKVVYVDDLSGEEINSELGGGPLPFMWDGERYVIDLGLKNRDKYAKIIHPLIEAARRPTEDEEHLFGGGVGRRNPARGPRPGAAKPPGRSKEELQAIRDWAAKNGHTVAPKGRIASEVIEAFEAQHTK